MTPIDLNRIITPDTLIVSHDAGAANLIVQNIKADLYPNLRVIAEGPAGNIFSRYCRVLNRSELKRSITQSQKVVTGTSWQSELEIEAIRMSKSQSRHVVSIVDRNINLELRFKRSLIQAIPDLIAVPHSEDFNFPELLTHTPKQIFLNEHFNRAVNIISHLRKNRRPKFDILFIGQPIVSANGEADYDKQFAYLEKFQKFNGQKNSILFRAHPSEINDLNVRVPRSVDIADLDQSIESQIASADLVVGFNSVVLDTAEAANVQVLRLPVGD
jgi:hypothetical protein